MISILINNRKGFSLDKLGIKAEIERVLEKHKKRGSFEISIALVDESEIRQLNKKYRGIDKPTCVLSFGQEDQKARGESLNSGQAYPNKKDRNFSFPIVSGIKRLGDIIICPPVVFRKGYSLEFLAGHGTEHLLGIHHEHSDLPSKIQAKKNSRT